MGGGSLGVVVYRYLYLIRAYVSLLRTWYVPFPGRGTQACVLFCGTVRSGCSQKQYKKVIRQVLGEMTHCICRRVCDGT